MIINESLDYSGCEVDQDAGIIKGIKVIGEKSKNGMIYPESTRRAAHALIEGIRVNVDHNSKGKQAEDVPLARRLGKLINVREAEGGTFADLRYFKSHPISAVLVEAAQHPEMSDLMGLSINGSGAGKKTKDGTLVESISRLRSVDLVSDPAAVLGLREAEDTEDIEDELSSEEHYEHACIKSCIDKLIECLDDEEKVEESTKAIKGHLKDHHKRKKAGAPKEEEAGDSEEEVEESLRREGRLTDVQAGSQYVPAPDKTRQAMLLIESMGVSVTSSLVDEVREAEDEAEARAKILAHKRKGLVKQPRSGKAEVVVQESEDYAQRDRDLVNSIRTPIW